MRQSAVKKFFVVSLIAICAIWTGSAFTYMKNPANEAKPSAIKKLDIQLSNGFARGVRNIYGLR